MDRALSFNQGIKRDWLDAAAAIALETDDAGEMRGRLRPIIAIDRTGADAIEKTLDILTGLWLKSRTTIPHLAAEAAQLYVTLQQPQDRLWLHYGLALCYNLVFERCVTTIGQLSRFEVSFTNRRLLSQLGSELGSRGTFGRSVAAVVWSLRDWGMLLDGDARFHYVPRVRQLEAQSAAVERWLLRCALTISAAEELPFEDLLRLPFLFPFRFTLGVGDVRDSAEFTVERQGLGLNMVRLT